MARRIPTEGATEYTVVFVNNSSMTASACIFQQDPTIGVSDVMSLAWLTQPAAPQTTIKFQWTTEYSFMWAQTGVLQPGVTFTAGQSLPADLTAANQVTFTRESVGQSYAYTFKDQTQGPAAGTLYVQQDGTIPSGAASVGVGMSGAGTFAVQAQPNLNVTFTPNPEYWIDFGTYTPGMVMDISETTDAQQIAFPENVYSVTATLNADNTWTIAPS